MIPGGGPDLQSSIDGGKTWTIEPTFSPLGAAPTANEGEAAGITSPDGMISSNGSIFLALKSDGQAWTSSDGRKLDIDSMGRPPTGQRTAIAVGSAARRPPGTNAWSGHLTSAALEHDRLGHNSLSAKYLQMYLDEYTVPVQPPGENMFALVIRKAASRA
jgi:hypothetical protein